MTTLSLNEILKVVEQLPIEEQENLSHLLQERIKAYRREEIIADIEEAQQEFKEGKCQVMTPEDIMKEILS